MDEIKISLDTAGSENEISVVRVDGVIDTITASELEKVMNKLLEQARYNIIIDLGGVDYISSAGWGIFISNIREIRHNRGDLKLARMIPNVREIYELLEFDTILQAYDSMEKAKLEFSLTSAAEVSSGNALPSAQATEILAEKPDMAIAVASPSAAQAAPAPSQALAGPAGEEERVIKLALEDPFLSIREMKKILNSEAGDKPRLGWWQIRRILRRHDILSRKKRFRLARNRH